MPLVKGQLYTWAQFLAELRADDTPPRSRSIAATRWSGSR